MCAQIVVADQAGACYGVERALEMVRNCMGRGTDVYTLGPLIHNPSVVEELESHGVTVVESCDAVPAGDILVIRSHGVAPEVVAHAVELGLDVVDATCPFVKKAQDRAADLASQGYQVVVVGEEGHPEVVGIHARSGADALVAGCPEDLEGADLARKVGVVVQTTQSASRLAQVVAAIAPRVRELRVMNTICSATEQRQAAAARLAEDADAMVVVGGRNSGNTRRLAEICSAIQPRTHHIESCDELVGEWFDGCGLVGVTAGASTPASQIDAVVAALQRLTDPGRA